MRQPFVVVNIASGSFACPGWFPVSKGTKPSELADMDFGIKIKPEPAYVPQPKVEELILSSNGKDHYMVKFNGMYWSCNCKGYGFRRYCRHIEEVKQKYK